jgi:hypothetical protein
MKRLAPKAWLKIRIASPCVMASSPSLAARVAHTSSSVRWPSHAAIKP